LSVAFIDGVGHVAHDLLEARSGVSKDREAMSRKQASDLADVTSRVRRAIEPLEKGARAEEHDRGAFA
jgi:hypothetical protein